MSFLNILLARVLVNAKISLTGVFSKKKVFQKVRSIPKLSKTGILNKIRYLVQKIETLGHQSPKPVKSTTKRLFF